MKVLIKSEKPTLCDASDLPSGTLCILREESSSYYGKLLLITHNGAICLEALNAAWSVGNCEGLKVEVLPPGFEITLVQE